MSSIKFDSSKYSITLTGRRYAEPLIPTQKTLFSTIKISNGDVESENLRDLLFQKIKPKSLEKKNKPFIKLVEVLENYNNGGLQVLVLTSENFPCWLYLNDQLELYYVCSQVGTLVTDTYRGAEDSFYTHFMSINEIYNNKPSDYIETPLDALLRGDKTTYSSILDFENYQLLFQENTKTKKTTVQKFDKN